VSPLAKPMSQDQWDLVRSRGWRWQVAQNGRVIVSDGRGETGVGRSVCQAFEALEAKR
jgi:hypothetical protein